MLGNGECMTYLRTIRTISKLTLALRNKAYQWVDLFCRSAVWNC